MDTEDPPPPLFGTWPRAYAVVLVWLAVQIAVFTWFGAHWP